MELGTDDEEEETKDEMDATQKALNQKKSSSSIYTDMEQRVQKMESEGMTLPAHLEREDWKERRRVKMLPHLAMKKPMYDNVKMLVRFSALSLSLS